MIVQSQTSESIFIGDNDSNAKRIVNRIANQDIDFKYEEYKGWYEGIDEYVNQYAIWGSDGMLFMNVLTVEGKVVFIMSLSPEPSPHTSQKELDQIKSLLRGENSPSDIVYLRNNTYKVLINKRFYSYRKHFILFSSDGDKIVTYIMDASNFEALQRYSKIWETNKINKLEFRYL